MRRNDLDSINAETRPGDGPQWAARALGIEQPKIDALAGDASFRRYFRVHGHDVTAILMDAPPDKEDCRPFVDVCRRLRAGGVHAPDIIAADLERGLLLLEDLGDELLRDHLHTNNADHWFPLCFSVLQAMARGVDASGLPAYDRQRLLVELELFPQWYLQRHKGIRLSCEDWDSWEALCTWLMASAAEQPQVFVHRDFHSCNLMVQADGSIGVIDFQDAVRGPLTYDFVSLVWDRYITWPRSRLRGWMEAYRQAVAPGADPQTWVRWCDLMGLQRNLKIVGIFARLHYRDGKDGYLPMIPRFWDYLMDVMPLYEETEDFRELLERLQCAP